MKIVVNTNVVSPHVVPFALALASECGCENVTYSYFGNPSDPVRSRDEYSKIENIALDARNDRSKAKELARNADVLFEGVREFEVFEERARNMRPTFYVSERWFKPIRMDSPARSEYARGRGLRIQGFWKLLLPFALKRAIRMARLMNDRENKFLYLANGIHAARDMARMCGLMNGDLKCLFGSPELEYERKPGGRIWLKRGCAQNVCDAEEDKRYCLDKMRMWGYFVEPSKKDAHSVRRVSEPFAGQRTNSQLAAHNSIRVLWVGRLLSWKGLGTVFKAMAGLRNVSLDIYGDGPEKERLIQESCRYNAIIRFHPKISYGDVRRVMREHDVFVLSSNSFEGWGAVINEALEEDMKVIGTYEAGSSATILPESNLFHAGDWRKLRIMLLNSIPEVSIGNWTSEFAAKEFLKMIEAMS